MREVWSLYRFITSLPLFYFALDFQIDGSDASAQDVEQHLEMGKKMLAQGALADALSHFHAAVDGDPSNYMTYFRRATVYLAMGKSKSALPDLKKVIELRPDFHAAKLQRGGVLLKQGKLDEAKKDFDDVLLADPGNAGAKNNLDNIEAVKLMIKEGKEAYENNDFQHAIDTLHTPIDLCPWYAELREIRAECYIAQGDLFKATSDIRTTTKLINDNTDGYYKLSKLHYDMGEADESLIQIRECLKLDPDHKACFPFYKKVKKLVKQMDSIQNFKNEQRWDDCTSKAKSMLQTEPDAFHYVMRAKSHMCHCESKAEHIKEAFEHCNEVLGMDENNIETLCDRAEVYLVNEQYDEAINDYEKAIDVDNNNNRAKEGLERAKKLLKQSQKRDYYKILGVKRNARKKEIIKAYRKLAMEWHPDKFESEEEKKKAEKKFMDIASAKEVLTDPEKRQKFDNGEDPLDAEEQAQGNNPFHQGFNPFGGGGFSFKFHY
ncbi:unnamed protein product [Owenia fusiformis]|uniref:Uncharacterized protein n=1 Tax=Owenia fusiformis TaxID=6347 RepID=A0A8J1YA41_OWEFU|nr:unnamed protein product [Owenia fusiformis]